METNNQFEKNESANKTETQSTNPDVMKDFFKKGMEDASKRAEEFAPKFREEVESILGEVAYGAGFVPGFLGTIVKEFLPETYKEPLKKGAQEGQNSAKATAQKVKEAVANKSTPEEPGKSEPLGVEG